MRQDFRLQNLGFRLSVVLLSGVALGSASALALTEGNPYAAISGRNVFALKPPTPPPVVDPGKNNAPPPNIELQGFTTILGRAQVLLKIKLPARPPEPAKDRSVVMDVGQREGDVEVLEMDAYAGVVKLKNQGNPVSLNLKDNGSKPAAGPALVAPALPAPPGTLPRPTALPAPAAPGAATTFGGAAAPTSPGANLPTRSIRSGGLGSTGGGVSTPVTPQNDVRNLPLDAQIALIEVERERTREAVEAGKMPPIPNLNLPK